MKNSRSSTLVALAFLGPFLAMFAIFMAYPLAETLWLSLHRGGLIGGLEFNGLNSYFDAFHDRAFVRAMLFTITYVVLIIPTVLLISLLLALLVTKSWVRGANAFRALLFLPNLMPMATLAVLWTFMVHPQIGLINMGFKSLGLVPPVWRGSASAATASIVLVELWRGIGFYMITFMAGIVAIPRELYEAAKMDGATDFQQFMFVTLPNLRKTIFFCVVIATIFNLQVFDSIFVVTGGGPAGATESVAWYIFSNAFRYDQIGRASAMATLLFIAIGALTFVQFRLFRKM
ncbi:carbohydrate ABC transporter permease [Rhizobium sp. X9]|uniref:carbohydrate ABC transporter permease n=1 Tax=Rhizobium sp. X9 TaxID=2815360 RepID=UPI001C0B7AC7|nr:sugar ABC transporter permease [Rhizobium sp. X9]